MRNLSKESYYLVILMTIRVILVLIPQHSYIQPDEFFQSTEPIAGDVFDTKVLLVWEFNQSFPLRNIFFPQLISRPVFTLIKEINLSNNPMALLVGPRLVVTLLSFICDYSLYRLCQYSKRSASSMSSMIVMSSSYLTLTYLTHTFSNSIETVLVSLLLLNSFKSISSNTYSNSNTIGSLLALGLFNRPTFVVFAFAPLLFWLVSNSKQQKLSELLKTGTVRALSLMPSFISLSIILCIFDTLYYSQNSVEIYENIMNYRFEELLKSLVITPLNFVKYNLNPSNLANHGLHPPYFHMLVSVPLAFSLLGIFAYIHVFKILKETLISIKNKTQQPLMNVFEAIMILSFVVPLLAFSLIPHQEPRFLIPSLIPLCFLYGNRIFQTKFYFSLWLLINLVLIALYGFIHQSGVTKGLFSIHQIIQQNNDKPLDFVFSRTYLPPRHLLNIPNSSKNIHIHDLSILEFPNSLDNKINEIKTENRDNFYLLIPSCLTSQLRDLFIKHNLKFELIKQLFPHFTFEDLETSLKIVTTSLNSFRNAFSINLWKVYFNSQ